MSNAGTTAHSLGQAVERLRGEMGGDHRVRRAAGGSRLRGARLLARRHHRDGDAQRRAVPDRAARPKSPSACIRADWGLFFLWVIGGVLYLAAGVICIVNPVLASVVLTLVLGAGLLAAGVVRLVLAFRLPPVQPRLLIFVAATVTILLGLVIVSALADGQRLRIGNPARRRPPLSWGGLGEFRLWDCTREAEPSWRPRS